MGGLFPPEDNSDLYCFVDVQVISNSCTHKFKYISEQDRHFFANLNSDFF